MYKWLSLPLQADRPNGGMRLQTAAFEAINELVRQATNDTLPLVVQLVPVFIQRLSSTLQMQSAAADASERQSEVQARAFMLCTVFVFVPIACLEVVPSCLHSIAWRIGNGLKLG